MPTEATPGNDPEVRQLDPLKFFPGGGVPIDNVHDYRAVAVDSEDILPEEMSDDPLESVEQPTQKPSKGQAGQTPPD